MVWEQYSGLSIQNRRTLSIETASIIQVWAWRCFLVLRYFRPTYLWGGMAIIAGWWSIWHILSGTALAFYWGRGQSLDGATRVV
ncbi:MAG: hypothetical protein R2822_26565 [Spirosomataceae bacterium]